MEKWIAHFKDMQHDMAVTIENDFHADNIRYSIRMIIDGIAFTGMEFDDFELEDEAQAEIAKKMFKLLKWGKSPNYRYLLQHYQLSFEIPVKVIEVRDCKEKNARVLVSYSCAADDKKTTNCITMLDTDSVYPDIDYCHSFALEVEDTIYHADMPSLDFETSFLQICKKIKGEYFLFSCFGCLYSDYSPYGNGYFAAMLCFVNQADQYITCSSKSELWDVYEGGIQVQETFCCDKFRPRINFPGGYRGLIY